MTQRRLAVILGMIPNGTATISGSINGYTVAKPLSVVAVVTGTSFNVYIADRADGGGGGGGAGMGTRNALIGTSASNCTVSGYTQASAGNFTLSAPVDATSKAVDGTFDITFSVGTQTGQFKGSFSAAVCPNAKDMVLSNPMYCG
jgi:hypothetical protein